MARFVVTTIGSLGDLHPMFPVAGALMKRGHEVTFVVTADLLPSVIGRGFPYYQVRLPKQPLPPTATAKGADSPSEARAKIRDEYGPFLRRCIEVLEDACEGVDAILTAPHQIASAIVAERRRLPWATLTVFPGLIPSSYTVPEPHWLPALPTPAGRAVNSLTWKIYAYGLRYLSSDTIDAAVGAHGMKVNRKLFTPGGLSPHLCLVLCSPHYSPRQKDWPAHIKVTGYTAWDRPEGWQEPPDLAAFLAAGPPPVVVTASTAHNLAQFLHFAKEALEASGRRGIILAGRASKEVLGDRDHVNLDSGISAWTYLPLSHVLPHASMVIHHAGIGTAQATIMHGLPAVVAPFNFDQWFNASRLRALGVARIVSGAQSFRGGVLRYKHVTPGRLAAEMDEVERDPSYRDRARELATLMSAEDGASRACDEIEAMLRTRVRV